MSRSPQQRVAVLRRRVVASAVVLVAALAALGLARPWEDPAAAGAVPRPTVDRFDAARAMALVRLQLRAGPRPAGSPAQRAVAEQLRARLPGGRFEAVPGGLRNVVGELPGRGRPILLAAHYDTQPYPPGFVGANDAAAA